MPMAARHVAPTLQARTRRESAPVTGRAARVTGPVRHRAVDDRAGRIGALAVVAALALAGGAVTGVDRWSSPGAAPAQLWADRWDVPAPAVGDEVDPGDDEPLAAEDAAGDEPGAASRGGAGGRDGVPAGDPAPSDPGDEAEEPDDEPDEPTPEPTPDGPPQLGSEGAEVREIQERLRVHGAAIQADGYFGEGTDAALRAFQADQGLAPDGIAGPQTRTALLTDPAAPGPGSGGSGGSGGSDSDSGVNRDANAVLHIANEHRAAAGCPALTLDDRLNQASVLHAKDMEDNDYFSHTSQDGRSFADRIRAEGHPSPGGENIARGQRDAAAVMDAWMNSEGHRANILNCSFRSMGLGHVGSTWVQKFGYE